MLQDTKVPLTFHVNTVTANEEHIPINKVLSDKPIPNDEHDFNTSSALEYPTTFPHKETVNSAAGKPLNTEDKSKPDVVLGIGYPIRIGIKMDNDKTIEQQNNSNGAHHIWLQDVLKDIGDSSETTNASQNESNPEKENSVIIDVNNDSSKTNELATKQNNAHINDVKLGKVYLQATSHKEDKNGTDVETAGVSLTTESKGLQSGGLMKVLLSKLLGSDISEALKGKVKEELKSVSGLTKPNDKAQKQRPSLDEASTMAAGTLVESPPGTVKGVDTAQMNNQGSEPTSAPPPAPAPVPEAGPTLSSPPTEPAVVPNNPECVGGNQGMLLLSPAGDRVVGNVHPVGGNDCSFGLQRLPSTQVVSSPPTGMPVLTPSGGVYASTNAAGQRVESPPGTVMAVDNIFSNGINQMRADNGKMKR